MQSYYIISGEGEIGTWKRVETASITESLRDERQGGDRWARAVKEVYATEDGFAGYDVETGEVRSVPSEVVQPTPATLDATTPPAPAPKKRSPFPDWCFIGGGDDFQPSDADPGL